MEKRELVLPVLLGLLAHEVYDQDTYEQQDDCGHDDDLLDFVHGRDVDADGPLLCVGDDDELAVGDDGRPALLLALPTVHHREVLQVVVGAAQADRDERQLQGSVGLLRELRYYRVLVVALQGGYLPLERHAEVVHQQAVLLAREGGQGQGLDEEAVLPEVVHNARQRVVFVTVVDDIDNNIQPPIEHQVRKGRRHCRQRIILNRVVEFVVLESPEGPICVPLAKLPIKGTTIGILQRAWGVDHQIRPTKALGIV